MRYILTILFLNALTCQAQGLIVRDTLDIDSIICIPLKLGNLLERDRQKKVAYDTLARQDSILLARQRKEISMEDSINSELHKTIAAQDTVINKKDGRINATEDKVKVLEEKNKGKVPWWCILIAGGLGWLLAH